MSRIAFAWELGHNFGHLARDLPLALACRDAGHEVVFVSTRMPICRAVLGPYGFDVIEAPALRYAATTNTRGAINFADLLLQNGFADAAGLDRAVGEWLALFDRLGPAAMVCDFAPTALVAARLAALPTLLLGNGFEIPPRSTPLPSFRPWETIPAEALLHVESTFIARINEVLQPRGGPALRRLHDLYSTSRALIAYFPEFDHFGPRDGVEYVGPASLLPACRTVEPLANGPLIVVYLRAGISSIENIFIALSQLQADVVCVVPDMPTTWPRRYARLRMMTEPIDWRSVLPFARLVISHGSGTFADAVMAGVPVLMIPSVVEQYLAAIALERRGAGLVLRDRRSVPKALAAIERLLDDNAFRATAQALAARYAGFKPQDSVERQYAALASLLG